MIPARYPPAVKDTNYNKSPGVWNGLGEWKICVHTTETEGEPGYDNNRVAPHLTYLPKLRAWKQHYDLTRPSESLRSFDDYQTFQIEIVCYSNKQVADQKTSRLWVGDLPQTALQDLADCVNWIRSHTGIPAVWPQKQAFSYAQANTPEFRMTPSQFRAYGGLLGHQHTPTPNTHWDPGAFPWARFMQLLTLEEPMITEWLNAAGFTALHARGIVDGESAAAVVDYWVTKRADRSKAEHVAASSNILVALAGAGAANHTHVTGGPQ